MNDNKYIVFKGSKKYGKEITLLFQMMGFYPLFTEASDENKYYALCEDGVVRVYDNTNLLPYNMTSYVFFTYETFQNTYPFIVGEKVKFDDYPNLIGVIIDMEWNYDSGDISYRVNNNDISGWFMVDELIKINDEKTMAKISKSKTGHIFIDNDTYEDVVKINIGKDREIKYIDDVLYIVKKQPNYPTTYKECCDVLSISPYYNLRYHTYEPNYDEYATSNTLLSIENKLNTLGKLLICCKAYWKIAGEEMGLDKPWEPDWCDETTKHAIWTYKNTIVKDNAIHTNTILVFPTKEIRNAFYENFKDLIENCKELL
jgi:hypothetical protein